MAGGDRIRHPIESKRASPTGSNPWTVVGVFSLIMFVLGSDLNIVAPLVPPIARSFHVSSGDVGWLVTVFAGGYALASPLAGWLGDQLGNMFKILLGGLGAFAVFDTLTGLAPTYPILVLARVFTGMSTGAISPLAYALVADMISPASRVRAMSLVSMGFSLSTVAGVPLGLLLAREFGWRGTMIFLAVALVVAGTALKAVWRPPPSAWGRVPAHRRTHNTRTLVRLTWPSLSASLLAFFAVGMLYTYLPAFLETRGIRHSTELLYILGGYGAANLVGNYTLGRLGDRRGSVFAVRVAEIAEAVAITGMGLSAALLPVWTEILWSWAFAFTQAYIPDLKALAAAVPGRIRASSLAWNNTAMYVGMMIGSGVGARLFCPPRFWLLAAIAAAAILLGYGLMAHRRSQPFPED